MAYDHKKSNRALTDHQFSRDTAIGGTRLDDALGESVARFNNVTKGDLSARFVRNQFVFGYTPSPVTSNPVLMRTTTPSTPIPNVVAPVMSLGRAEAITMPWMPLPNSVHTTVKTPVSVTPPYPDRYKNEDGATPVDGFQNDWKIKGTDIQEYPDGRPPMTNANAYPNDPWLNAWSDRSVTIQAGEDVNVRNPYQLAWTAHQKTSTDRPHACGLHPPPQTCQPHRPFRTSICRTNESACCPRC